MHPLSAQLVIFGLTGDLAHKKLLPALYELTAAGLMADTTRIIGVSRRDVAVKDVVDPIREGRDPKVMQRLESMIEMYQMDLTDEAGYKGLRQQLDEHEASSGICANRIFYLSMPPQVFGPVIDLLGKSGLNQGCSHGKGAGESRILVEKPFGFDLASAEELVKRLAAAFDEEQIYRIDHYVAKETSQNILTFRFHNPLFAAAWDAHHIERITVTATETIGIEGRSAFYERTGALRDLIQNHLLQLLALVTMERPAELDAATIQTEKLKLFHTIPSIAPDEVAQAAVRGQYHGYREEVGNPQSHIETFAAVRLSVDNERWRGVPMVLQTGKALGAKLSEIAINFKSHPDSPEPNQLIIRVQPDEGICLKIMVKAPGLGNEVRSADMDFRYDRSFDERQTEAYERILSDAMRGDRTLFTTSDETLECWRIIEPVLQEWAKDGGSLIDYAPGTSPQKLVFGLK